MWLGVSVAACLQLVKSRCCTSFDDVRSLDDTQPSTALSELYTRASTFVRP